MGVSVFDADLAGNYSSQTLSVLVFQLLVLSNASAATSRINVSSNLGCEGVVGCSTVMLSHRTCAGLFSQFHPHCCNDACDRANSSVKSDIYTIHSADGQNAYVSV